MNKNAVVMFVKAPIEGFVKTRLGLKIGNKNATKLYKLFGLDLKNILENSNFDLFIAYYPEEKIEIVKEWLGADLKYILQKDGDLGFKMCEVFQDLFLLNYQKVIIIGSDTLTLTIDTFHTSFQKLDLFDTVIGPTFDGGYYLIGFTKNSFTDKAFFKITYSTNSVLEHTINRLKKKKIFFLEKLNDLDTFEDLINLFNKNQNLDLLTINYLKEHQNELGL